MGRLGIGDRLNQNSKQGVIFTKEYRKARLDPRTLIPSEHNKYAQDDIEELADNMLLVGQLQDVLVGRVNGKDRIIVGHRRREAAIYNINRGYKQFELINCEIKEMSEAMFMLTLHSANIFNRRLSDWELTEGVAEFKKYLVAAKEAGEVKIEGKMRDYIADAIGVSTGKMAQMESITNNLCEEGKEAFKSGDINFTTAYEASRLPVEKQKEVIESGEMLSGEVKQMVEQERQKKEPTAAAVKKFYEAHAKRYDGDRSKLKELCIEHMGRSHNGGNSGGVDYQCSIRGVKLENAEEITWTRFVQLVNDLYPVTEAEPEEQIGGQQDLDEYPEVTGGVSIKKDTAHFKIDGALNPDYTPMGLPYSCYITAVLHSGAFSQDFIESYKGSRGINALLNIIENYRKKLCYDENGKYAPGKENHDFKHEGKEYTAYFDNRGFNVESADKQYKEYLRDYDLLELLEAMLEAGYFGVVETLKNTIRKTVKKVSEHDTRRTIQIINEQPEVINAMNEPETVGEESQAAAVEEELDIAEATAILTADLFQLKEYISEDDFYTLQEIVINCELAARKGGEDEDERS